MSLVVLIIVIYGTNHGYMKLNDHFESNFAYLRGLLD